MAKGVVDYIFGAAQPKVPKPRKSKAMHRGHAVHITDNKIEGARRFAATYDSLPASIFGHGATRKDALAALDVEADRYGERRQRELDDEAWADHIAAKEQALKDGTY